MFHGSSNPCVSYVKFSYASFYCKISYAYLEFLVKANFKWNFKIQIKMTSLEKLFPRSV